MVKDVKSDAIPIPVEDRTSQPDVEAER